MFSLEFLQIKREVATMKLIKHPNVVRLYEVALSLSLCIVACEHILCVCTCMWAGAIYLSMILASRLLLLLFFFFTFFFFLLLFLLLSDLLLYISILTLLVSSNFPSSKNADGMLNSFIFLRFYFKIFFFLFLFSGNGEQDKDIHCFRVCYWGRAL